MSKYFRKKAMTLAEIMTAVGLLSVIIVVILGVFVKGSYAIKKTRYRLTALNLAESKITELKNLDFTTVIKKIDIVNNIVNVSEVSESTSSSVRTSSTPVTDDTAEISIWNTANEYKIRGIERIKDVDYEYIIFVENSADGEIDGDMLLSELKRVSVVISWAKSEERKTIEMRTLIARPGI